MPLRTKRMSRAGDEPEHGKGRDERAFTRQDDEPGHGKHEEDDERETSTTGRATDRVLELVPGVAGARSSLAACVDVDPAPEAVVEGGKGERRGGDGERGQRRLERPAAPDDERDRPFDQDRDSSVGMDRREQPGCERCRERGLSRPALERTHEQQGRQTARKGEERVHAGDPAVDRQQPGRRRRDGGGRPGNGPGEASPELEADQHGSERERSRKPAQRIRRGVDGEHCVHEQEVERRASSVPEHGPQQLAHGAGSISPATASSSTSGFPRTSRASRKTSSPKAATAGK